jgi:hypothetical protein
MNSKLILAGINAAIVLALTSPAYAGILGGGAGGGFGGGMNGGLSSFGGRSIGGAGNFGSQGQLNGSLNSVNPKPAVDAAKKAGEKATDKVDNSATATGSPSAVSNPLSAGGSAMLTSTSGTAPSAAMTPATNAPTPAPTAKPSPSTSLAGSTEQSANAANHSATGGGSFDAQHSKGSNTLTGAANGAVN